MNESFTEEYESLVAALANEYHKRYSMIEREDIAQVLWMWFVTHQNKYKEWSALKTKDKDKLIAKSLRHAALKHCEKEKARTVGYELLDLYYYDASVIEAFLPSIIAESYEIPTKIKDLGSQVRSNEINDGNNWLVLRSDIASAYYRLPEAKQLVLQIRFTTENHEWADIGKELDTTAEGARKKVQRAIASLIRNLGGWRPNLEEESNEPRE
jgi:DNA-directed RNA polymerase specialized sigma subunit